MPRPSMIRFTVAAMVLLLGAVPLAGAQVYKWVDDKGVVNYGSAPPASARGAKRATLVEDRVSVYSPDAALTQATQNARNRSGLPNPEGRGSTAQPFTRPPAPALATAPPPAPDYDPCALPGDVNCYGYPPVYPRAYPTPRLVQPQLPAGAIAGNVNQGNGYIPGLSSQAQPAPITPTTRPPARGDYPRPFRDERSAPATPSRGWR